MKEYCEVVYLPRTEGISSTQLRAETQQLIKIGIVGSGRIAKRFVPESKVVSGACVTAVYNPNIGQSQTFAQSFEIGAYSDYEQMLSNVDAVYIASPHPSHFGYAKRALEYGRHVLCEVPLVLAENEAKELYELAEKKNLVLLEANKTAYCPAFNHIVTMVKSGVVGDVVDIRTSLSKMVEAPIRELDAAQSGGAMNEHASITLLPIVKLLGCEYRTVDFYSKMNLGVDIYTKVILQYPHAMASATLGIGVKTEGDMVISGTHGYVYVPAPWWLTDFFEVRYEDRTKNKKYFYSYDGDGLRYEIQEFISMVVNRRRNCYKLKIRESVAIAEIIEKYNKRENLINL